MKQVYIGAAVVAAVVMLGLMQHLINKQSGAPHMDLAPQMEKLIQATKLLEDLHRQVQEQQETAAKASAQAAAPAPAAASSSQASSSSAASKDLTSPLSPGMSWCHANPFMRNFKQDEVEALEKKYVEWRKTQYLRLFNVLVDYLHADGVRPDAPDQEDDSIMTYGTRIGDEFIKLAFPQDSPLECPSGLKMYGTNHGTAKAICGLELLKDDDKCMVYSLGSNNLFDFETAVTEQTKCQVHTFDCTSNPPPTPISRMEFHKICIGEQDVKGRVLQSKLFPYARTPPGWPEHKIDTSLKLEGYFELMDKFAHQHVQLLKLDIEGGEYSLFADLLKTPSSLQKAPHQISFETHWWHRGIGHAMLTLQLLEEMWRVGYRFMQVETQGDSSCFEW
eukprot:CAMPEP_0114561708 /NCGR_PEP_ID=MMETSP0114-20121206/12145_1 /TAXON_ID=31324 /ORGANISM="Goniomonas sp, Strain m" /LENGTH=390 /DNA_ID=CAMNT_0001747355 /DNA_START=1 /DNA_END=1170 /DNA_ORIENTATION=+